MPTARESLVIGLSKDIIAYRTPGNRLSLTRSPTLNISSN
jgi:hypothetical protein